MSSNSLGHEVIVDAGPIIALARLDLLSLLDSLFDKASITSVVANECLANPDHHEHDTIRTALQGGQLRCVEWTRLPASSMWNLDPGEASTIALAKSSQATVLVDDLAARRMAGIIGVKVIGTCGLLLVAKRHGLVKAVRPQVEKLALSGYYLSQSLIETVCLLAEEN